MKYFFTIIVLTFFSFTSGKSQVIHLKADIFGDTLTYSFSKPIDIGRLVGDSEEEILQYIKGMDNPELRTLSKVLISFKDSLGLDDWIYYQLIRKVSEQIVPKSKNYIQYTLYKWYFLVTSGYDSFLTYHEKKILFYVKCQENIYNIPLRLEKGIQYVCLNYHDYGTINFQTEKFRKISTDKYIDGKAFTYTVNNISNNDPFTIEKWLHFSYNNTEYTFKLRLDPNIASYFKNYPSLDYKNHFNIPVSQETYNSLIPSLKKYLKGMNQRSGVDFLMHFTRYAFLFKPDTEIYGKDKRFSPEMTLLSESSDCEDRVSLLYFLIKEIYDLPMIIIVYPQHVSIAVEFTKTRGNTIVYNGRKFSICDPTPQAMDLKIGEILPSLKHMKFEVAFSYDPKTKN